MNMLPLTHAAKKIICSIRAINFVCLVLFCTTQFASAQDGVRIAASAGTADPSAMLDVISTAKGVLVPRMTAAQRTSVASPATGLLVFQTDGTPGFWYNAGTPGTPNWVILSAGALSGAGTVNYASKWTAGGILGNSQIFDNGTYVGVGTASPVAKLQVTGGIMRTNTRVNDAQRYPVAQDASGGIFPIDPTWTNAELQAYFNSSSVQWVNDATAPAGWAIQITGAVNVGGAYNSGFPYIPIDDQSTYYMECWIKNVSGSNTHYMGSIDYDHNFGNAGGNPGTYGYWTMSNYNPGSSWVKVSGYIKGFGTSVGTFKIGSKYWTPQALFNYTGGGSCMISGWKVIKAGSNVSGLINVSYFKDNVRRGLTDAGSASSLETFTVTKKSPTSILVVSGVLSCYGGYSGGSAIGVRYGSGTEQFVGSTTYIPTYGTSIPVKAVIAGHTTTGAQSLVIRVSGPYRPCNILNPSGADYPGYANQTSSDFVIEEIEP